MDSAKATGRPRKEAPGADALRTEEGGTRVQKKGKMPMNKPTLRVGAPGADPPRVGAPAADPPAPDPPAPPAVLVALQEQNARLMRMLVEREQRPVTPTVVPQAPAPAPTAEPKPLSPKSPPKSNLTTGLPAGWKSRLDNKSGRLYYYNKDLGKSQFEHPGDSPPLPPPTVQEPAATPVLYRSNSSLEAEIGALLAPEPSCSRASSSAPHSTHNSRSQWQVWEEMHADHTAKAAYAPSAHVRAYHAAEAARYARRMSQAATLQ